MLALSGNNLKNINNVVSLTTEHAICPFHLPGCIRKEKMHYFNSERVYSPPLSWFILGAYFNFKNKQMNICVLLLPP